MEFSSGQAAIDADDVLIEQLIDHPPGARKLRIWENQNCLVTTRRIARHNWFESAAAHSAKYGWPVHVRSTGGTTVVHRPGILNVSLAMVSKKTNVQPDDSYQELTKLLIGSLSKMGVFANSGFVQNSYCDGRYNICVGGKKIAGTASRIVRRNGKAISLCHASIIVYGPVADDVDLVRTFEAYSNMDCDIRIDRHLSIKSVLR